MTYDVDTVEAWMASYKAKASLMGMWYNMNGHYFFDKQRAPDVRARYDADTMEEITERDATDRRSKDYGFSLAITNTSRGNDG